MLRLVLAVLVLTPFILSGCKSEVKGTVKVESPLTVSRAPGANPPALTIPAGDYALSVSTNDSKTQFTLKDAHNKNYVFRTPDISLLTIGYGYTAQKDLGLPLPVDLPAKKIQQNFDIVAQITTREKNPALTQDIQINFHSHFGGRNGKVPTRAFLRWL